MKTRGLTVNRQMLYLFFSSFSILCVGFGLFPLLPIYAGRYGATPTTIGLYLALTYVSITLGTLLAGWLSGRAPRRLTQTLAGFTGVLALAGLGQADALWQVMLLTGLVWFTGGVGLANIDVMTGLLTNRANRGKSFSWIALTNPLGAIMGSLLVGQLVEWKGYPVMFAVLAAEYAIWPLIGLFLLQDQPVQARRADQSTSTTAAGPNRIFHFLLLSLLLSAMSISVERLGLSLQMKALDYSASAITGANVIGGLVTIPVVLWFGKLSDRLGRKMFLLSGYLLAALGGVTLLMAGHLWHFWLVAAATLIARSISASVASALATDILPPEAIGRSLPWVGTTSWIAGVVGFAASGFVIDLAGVASLFAIATLLSIGAASLVSRLPGSIPVLALRATRTRATASPAPCGATDVPPL